MGLTLLKAWGRRQGASSAAVQLGLITAVKSCTHETNIRDSTVPSVLGDSDHVRTIPLASLNYIVFDFETTGLDAQNGDEIIELGALKVEGKNLSNKTFHSLINPQCELPDKAVEVHGITKAELIDAPTIVEVMPQFLQFLGQGVLVAQNARFDLAFLVKNLARLCISRFDNQVLDTMLLSKYLFSYESRHNLDAIVDRLQIERQEQARHRSMGDCLLTAKALVRMIELLEKRGLGNLRAIRNCLMRTGPIPVSQRENMSLF